MSPNELNEPTRPRRLEAISARTSALFFVSLMKLTDCASCSESFLLAEHTARRDGENSETDTWLDLAKDCGYLAGGDYDRLAERCSAVDSVPASSPEGFQAGG
jgi:hypothetical protein